MQLKKGQIVEILVEKLAFGGRGIGEVKSDDSEFAIRDSKGYKIFVDGVVPGDLVEVSLVKIKKNYAEGKLEKILKFSDLRIKPQCQYFEKCGGCTWQFLDYHKQLQFKEEQVQEILKHIGGFDLKTLPIIGAKEEFFYRNKMEFSFGDGEDRKFALGLHIPGRRYDVLDIEKCYLQSELSNKILKTIRNWVLKNKLTFYKFKENKGLLRNLVIREGKNTEEMMINLVCSDEKFDKNLKKDFVDLIKDIDQKICSIILTQISVGKGRRTSMKEETLSKKGNIVEALKIGDLIFKFNISPCSFFQPNSKQAEILYSKVLEFADLKGEEIVYDLYCGTGTIGIILSKFCKKVYGIELVEDAVKNGRENANLNNCKNIEFLCGDATKFLGQISDKPNVIIVDPPRAGLSNEAIENILKCFKNSRQQTTDSRLIYVSCNPATFARDVKIFCEQGFKLEKVQPIDMFPHTYHVENVGLLVKHI